MEMNDELPENIDLNWIGRHLLSTQKEMRIGFAEMKAGIARIDGRVMRVEGAVDELSVAVAALSVSNRQIRADVSKVLANQDDHEQRIRKIEKHLGLDDQR